MISIFTLRMNSGSLGGNEKDACTVQSARRKRLLPMRPHADVLIPSINALPLGLPWFAATLHSPNLNMLHQVLFAHETQMTSKQLSVIIGRRCRTPMSATTAVR